MSIHYRFTITKGTERQKVLDKVSETIEWFTDRLPSRMKLEGQRHGSILNIEVKEVDITDLSRAGEQIIIDARWEDAYFKTHKTEKK